MNIPFEWQQGTRVNGMCGAAALCMVYRSLGVPCSQLQVWEHIARPLGNTLSARTYLLAADATQRGIQAVVLQARDPWAMLQRCLAAEVRVILNHRARPAAQEGHYSVLVDATADAVVVHDPRCGPNRRFTAKEWLALWSPEPPASHIAGHVLVVFAREEVDRIGVLSYDRGRSVCDHSVCMHCGMVLPADLPCPRCRMPVALCPVSTVGCLGGDCPARTWTRIFCPHCDAIALERKI